MMRYDNLMNGSFCSVLMLFSQEFHVIHRKWSSVVTVSETDTET